VKLKLTNYIGHAIGAGASVATAALLGKRAVSTGKMYPAGILALSASTALGYHIYKLEKHYH